MATNNATDFNTITVGGVTYNAKEYEAMLYQQKQASVKDNSSLGKDAFLQLLVTQMQYQDPLEPQDNSEYVAQLAQFSSLEQMTNVAEKLTDVYSLVENIDTSVLVGQLSGMIGKDIQWIAGKDVAGNNVQLEGNVTGVSISDGQPSVIAVVKEKDAAGNTVEKTYKVSVSDLVRVGAADDSKNNNTTTNTSNTSNTTNNAGNTTSGN